MKVKFLFVTIAIIAIIILILPIVFYYKLQANEKEKAIEKCVNACKQAMIAGKDLSNGPCLLNPIPELKDWVCDVAHWPRQPVDNLAENQCSYFREGKARHFVEVDIACNFIRAY
jgi:type II secretory pathway pseudopilin PulG